MPLEFFTDGPLRTLLRVGGLDVTYHRGEDSGSVRLMPADQDNPAASQHGYVREWGTRDWIGVLADLVIDDEMVKPEPGDEIHIAGPDEAEDPAEIWQVAAGLNQQCWEPLAGNRSGFRVHTVRLA
jgi:hypothetical protein